MTLIGYQSGVRAAVNRLRDLDPNGTALKKTGGKWPAVETLPADMSRWGAWDKLERTLGILAFDHDAAAGSDPPPPPPPPPPAKVAPRTYNTAPGGEPSARFCTTGLPRNTNGRLHDDFSEYDDDGHDLGGRTTKIVAGLKYANEMDGRGPCDPYGSFPPWPAGSFER